MLLSRASQYTLQALIYLARQPDGRLVMVKEIADALGLPMFYLAKLIQPPTRAGWLSTARGRGGGVRLNPGAETVTLLDILRLTEDHRASGECLLGFKDCEDESACVLHRQWKPIKQELIEGLGRHSLADLARGMLPTWLLGDVSTRRTGLNRGRDTHCWAPPAQIPACPIRAPGSYLG